EAPAPATLPALRLHCDTSAESSLLQCVLTGRWISDLGSNMTIVSMNRKGDFTRSYHTVVMASTNEIQVSLLQGSQHCMNQKSQPTFGFTINWSFSDAVTVFTGQCFMDKEGKEVLKTMWLLQCH
ncbi:AVID protein, partial [Cepphus grylle]|nr:AVID protein [Cepphus grylle]